VELRNPSLHPELFALITELLIEEKRLTIILMAGGSKEPFLKIMEITPGQLKGTVSRDFRPSVFFVNRLPLGP
jgi:hypothetical protein